MACNGKLWGKNGEFNAHLFTDLLIKNNYLWETPVYPKRPPEGHAHCVSVASGDTYSMPKQGHKTCTAYQVTPT